MGRIPASMQNLRWIPADPLSFRPARRFRPSAEPASQIVTVDFHNFRVNARACPINAPATSGFWKKPKKRRFTTLPFAVLRTRESANSPYHSELWTPILRPWIPHTTEWRYFMGDRQHNAAINTMNRIANETWVTVNFAISLVGYDAPATGVERREWQCIRKSVEAFRRTVRSENCVT